MVCDENYVDSGMVDDVRKFWKLKVWWIDCEVDVWELNAKKECLKKKKKKIIIISSYRIFRFIDR